MSLRFPDMLKHKLCKRCGLIKSALDFHKKRELKSGLSSWCKVCRSEDGKKHREKPGVKQAHRDRMREYTKQHYDRIRRSKWLSQGINFTFGEFNHLFELQEGCCAICGKHQSEFKKSLGVDHNHETGQIRNLVCMKCNTFIGYVENAEENFETIKVYLKAWAKKDRMRGRK